MPVSASLEALLSQLDTDATDLLAKGDERGLWLLGIAAQFYDGLDSLKQFENQRLRNVSAHIRRAASHPNSKVKQAVRAYNDLKRSEARLKALQGRLK